MIRKINTKGKNKAIQGRRNRVHAKGPIIVYPAYDMASKAELDKNLAAAANDGRKYLLIPDNYKMIIPVTGKKPRFI